MLRKGAAKYLALAFALIFLVFQSSTLVHSHAGDLNKHLDCTFCLTMGSAEHAVPVSVALNFPTAASAAIAQTPQLVLLAPALVPRSRSPPR